MSSASLARDPTSTEMDFGTPSNAEHTCVQERHTRLTYSRPSTQSIQMIGEGRFVRDSSGLTLAYLTVSFAQLRKEPGPENLLTREFGKV